MGAWHRYGGGKLECPFICAGFGSPSKHCRRQCCHQAREHWTITVT